MFLDATAWLPALPAVAVAVLHWISGFVVVAEGLNKLERTDPLQRGLSRRQRFVVLLKVAAWFSLVLGGAGALARPLVAGYIGDVSLGPVHLTDRVSLADLLVLGGFALLIVRSRFKEHPVHISQNVSMEEFIHSDAAARLSIDNSLPATLLMAAQDTCQMVERIRAHLSRVAGRDVPIWITSGYRCAALNSAIGSGPGSDHPRALAVDFKAPAFGTPYQVAAELATHVSELGIGQLIHEFGSWVHVSTRKPDKQLNRIITISKAGTVAGVQEVA